MILETVLETFLVMAKDLIAHNIHVHLGVFLVLLFTLISAEPQPSSLPQTVTAPSLSLIHI